MTKTRYRVRCGSETHDVWLAEDGTIVFTAHPEAFETVSRAASYAAIGGAALPQYEGCLLVVRALVSRESLTVPAGDARRLLAAVDGIRHARGVRRAARRWADRG